MVHAFLYAPARAQGGTAGEMARVIVITSGKGGVGKTTVTAGLGRALAKKGKRVVLMDADLGLNNIDVVMDAESRVVYDILDVVENRCRPRQALVEDFMVPGLFILPGAGYDDGSKISGQNLRAVIHSLSPSFDFIFIDCPAGIEAGFHRAVAAADEAIIVTTPHVSALRDADKVVALLKSYRLETHLIVNRARGDMILGQEQLSCDDIAGLLQVSPIGILPEDDAINTYNCFMADDDKRSDGDVAIDLIADNLLSGGARLFDVTKKYRGFFGGIKRSLKRIV